MEAALPDTIGANYLNTLILEPLAGVKEAERIYMPWLLPRHNKAQNWHPMKRTKNVRLIHEAVLLSSEHMFDREELPRTWMWHEESGERPLVKGIMTPEWFNKRWTLDILGRKTYPKHGCGTVIEMFKLDDGRTHIHVHNIVDKLGDVDGVYLKHLVDGLVLAGFFPDDKPEYVAGVTETQELNKTKQKRIKVT